MDVRIGVIYTSKEIEVELGDDAKTDTIQKDVDGALSKGGTLWLTDKRGRRIGVPADKIAYVEIGGGGGERRIGFVG